MFTYPGKKLLFMGGEFGQGTEWNSDRTLDWYVLDYPYHQGVKQIIQDLNNIYKTLPEMHFHDVDDEGFQWIDCHDHENSIISYIRKYRNKIAVVVLNFTPVPRDNYVIGVPYSGKYEEILNSDSSYYAGSNYNTKELAHTDNAECMGYPYSLELKLPPLAGIIFTHTD